MHPVEYQCGGSEGSLQECGGSVRVNTPCNDSSNVGLVCSKCYLLESCMVAVHLPLNWEIFL